VGKGFRYKRWYELVTGARCPKCRSEWKSVFEVYDLHACPECGYHVEQSDAYKAAFPSESKTAAAGKESGK